MRKFKLIKEYPGSPKLGTEVSNIGNNINEYYYNGLWVGSYPDKYPEFWEEIIEYPIGTKVLNSEINSTYVRQEDGWYKTSDKTAYTDEMISKSNYINIIKDGVIEKNYEILSYSSNLNSKIYYKSTYNNFENKELKHFISEEFGNKFYKINSVKRLSDGEVFTIGDKVTRFRITVIIDSMRINSDNKERLYIVGKPLEKGESRWSQHLDNSMVKLIPSLFTTEDNVEIFHPSKFWILRSNKSQWDWLFETETSNNINYTQKSCKGELIKNDIRYFSTKVAAEEYILMNKSCLSINEINSLKEITFKDWDKTLKELVKEKLKT